MKKIILAITSISLAIAGLYFYLNKNDSSEIVVKGNVEVKSNINSNQIIHKKLALPETTEDKTYLEKIINKIIKEKTDILLFKFNEFTLTDEDTQSRIDERYLRMKVVVPNEIRERINLPLAGCK